MEPRLENSAEKVPKLPMYDVKRQSTDDFFTYLAYKGEKGTRARYLETLKERQELK